MLTKEQVAQAGFTILPQGGWIRLDPTIISHDWNDICKYFASDPECKELILCVCGVKEIYEEKEDEDV